MKTEFAQFFVIYYDYSQSSKMRLMFCYDFFIDSQARCFVNKMAKNSLEYLTLTDMADIQPQTFPVAHELLCLLATQKQFNHFPVH